MKHIIVGDLLAHPKGLIVHGCNTQGKMGSGVALAVKNRYPEAYQAYMLCHEGPGRLELGQIIHAQVGPDRYIVNAMTQIFFGPGQRHTNYEAVAVAFENIREEAHRLQVTEIAYPLIGAGLGGGNWRIIDTIIDETLRGEFDQYLYGFEDQLRAAGALR